MKKFALIGAAGFVAERHLKAIKETGNQLVAATDPFDVVGRLDRYFPDAAFFTHSAEFDQFIAANPVDYTSICTPNYLHATHIQTALHAGSNVICEKPLVLFPGELEAIATASQQSDKSVSAILQLRLHPVIAALRNEIGPGSGTKIHDIELTYVTSRGKWYDASWKGDGYKSGGIAANIGIHFFDLLLWLFGESTDYAVHLSEPRRMAGYLRLARARVRWFLSVDESDLPESARLSGGRTFRAMTVDGRAVEFSDGFADLHTACYREIIAGRGFGIADARAAVVLTHAIRNTPASAQNGELHPILK